MSHNEIEREYQQSLKDLDKKLGIFQHKQLLIDEGLKRDLEQYEKLLKVATTPISEEYLQKQKAKMEDYD